MKNNFVAKHNKHRASTHRSKKDYDRNMQNKHIGSLFDDFLEDEGIVLSNEDFDRFWNDVYG